MESLKFYIGSSAALMQRTAEVLSGVTVGAFCTALVRVPECPSCHLSCGAHTCAGNASEGSSEAHFHITARDVVGLTCLGAAVVFLAWRWYRRGRSRLIVGTPVAAAAITDASDPEGLRAAARAQIASRRQR